MKSHLIDIIKTELAEFFHFTEYLKKKELGKEKIETKRAYVDNLHGSLSTLLDNTKINMLIGLSKTPITYDIEISPKMEINQKICITINNLATENTPSSNIEIILNDHKLKYEQKFNITSLENYKKTKSEICKYLTEGQGSWIYQTKTETDSNILKGAQ